MSDIYLPTAPVSPINRVVKITEGGTGATTREGALLALGAVDADKVNVVGGALTLGPDGKLEIVTQVVTVGSQVAVVGPKTVVVGKPATYQISNLHSPGSYTLASTNGTLTRSGDQIAFTPTAVNAATTFTVNSKPVTVNVIATTVATPSITYPLAGTANLGTSTTGVSSAFSSTTSGDVHEKTDWQVSTNSSFSSFTFQSLDDVINKTAIALSSLTQGTTYYIRVRHKGTLGGTSAWSATGSFTIPLPASINTPSITTPSNGATGVLRTSTFTSSVFAVSNGTDVHLTSDWQIATDAGFSNIVNSVSTDYSNKTTWGVGGLAYNTRYYVRVRYSGVSVGTSAWSAASTFVTEVEVVLPPATVNTPSITSPYNGQSGMERAFTVYASAFAVSNGSSSHMYSDWQIATDAGFSNIVNNNSTDYVNKTSYSVSGLNNSTTYYVRVRYISNGVGSSAWSAAAGFTIKNAVLPYPSLEVSILTASNGGSYHQFGTGLSLSTDGNTLAVGSPGFYPGGNVYIYTKNGNSWGNEISLPLPSDYANGDQFGASVSLSANGNMVIVGAPAKNNSRGVVYLYSRSGGSWSLIRTFGPDLGTELQSNCEFGRAVLINSSGTNVFIGAPFYANSSFGGVVYQFRDIGGSWAFVSSTFAETGSKFGRSLAISDDDYTLVVGAYGSSSNQGFVSVLTKSGNSYSTALKITASDGQANDAFGVSVAINAYGNTIVIGASGVNSNTGAAYVFTGGGGSWSLQSKLTPSPSQSMGAFGGSVDISSSGDCAIIGSANIGGSYAGSAGIFMRSSGSWSQQVVLHASNGYATDYFGNEVRLSGSGLFAVVAARGLYSLQGAVYSYA